jgi:hypothetical protein
MKQISLIALLSLTLMVFGCSPSEPESEGAAQDSTPTTQESDSFENQVAEYIQKFPYQDTFNYVMRYTGGDPKNFGSSAKFVGRNDALEVRKNLKAHPDPNSEKMELQHSHRLGGRERDATQDYPKSGSETRVVRLWTNTPDRERTVGVGSGGSTSS